MANHLQKIFEKVAENNTWGGDDSISGPGSNYVQTEIIRKEIPVILRKYKIRRLLDVPCGDFFWMKQIKKELAVSVQSYVGGDIVPQIIKRNSELYADEIFSFREIDITKDSLPNVDLILTRDCFLHLSYLNIYKALLSYKLSGSTFLLVSTYTKKRPNTDVEDVSLSGRALNMQSFPFCFSKPLDLIIEGCTEGNNEYTDKSLALWRLKALNLTILKVYLFLKSLQNSLSRIIGD